MAKNGSVLKNIIVERTIIRQEAEKATRRWHRAQALLAKDHSLYARSIQAIERSRSLIKRITSAQNGDSSTDEGTEGML